MKNLKVYLSGPMTGLPNKNKDEFDRYAFTLRTKGFLVVSPVEMDDNPDQGYDNVYYRCLKAAVAAMLTCEVVVILPGWKESKGAVVEVDLANSLKMPVYSIEELLNGK